MERREAFDLTSKIRANSNTIAGIIEDIDTLHIQLSRRPIRGEIGDISPLAESIRRSGLLQPIVVRLTDDYFEIIAGNRRFLACKYLNLRKIPCHVIDLPDKEAYEISLMENLQRRNMDPIEEGLAYSRYIVNYGWGGVSELAKVIGKSQEYVSKRIKLLELPEELKNEIIRRRIKVSIGEELAYIRNKETQSRLAKMVSQRHVTIKQLRHEISSATQEWEFDKSNRNFEETYRKSLKAYDKTIITLKLTLRRLNEILEGIEETDWLIAGSLLQQRATISAQIDSLLKERRKYSKFVFKRRPLIIC